MSGVLYKSNQTFFEACALKELRVMWARKRGSKRAIKMVLMLDALLAITKPASYIPYLLITQSSKKGTYSEGTC